MLKLFQLLSISLVIFPVFFVIIALLQTLRYDMKWNVMKEYLRETFQNMPRNCTYNDVMDKRGHVDQRPTTRPL